MYLYLEIWDSLELEALYLLSTKNAVKSLENFKNYVKKVL